MNIPNEYKDYTVECSAEGSKQFFTDNAPENWTFECYLNGTHDQLNKNSLEGLKCIYNDYHIDMDWVKSIKLPIGIKKYVKFLKKQEKFSVSELKTLLSSKQTSKSHIPIILNTGKLQFGNNNTQSIFQGLKRKMPEVEKDQNESAALEYNENIWNDWLDFLKLSRESNDMHKYSPERHGIIRCGKGISPRPNLPKETYKKYKNIESRNAVYSLSTECKEYIDSVIDADSIADFHDNLRNISRMTDPAVKVEVYFLQDIFSACLRLFKTTQKVDSTESFFNYLFVHPFLEAVVQSCNSVNKLDFAPGEETLLSMSKQLKDIGATKDDRDRYLADGIIRVNSLMNAEILLLETSYEFRNKDKTKKNFDHHKGMFGCLSMLKSIADSYRYATMGSFKKLKIYFVHAADESVNLWSVCLMYNGKEEEGFYKMFREEKLCLTEKFEEKENLLPELVRFYWVIRGLLMESVKAIEAIRNSHIQKKREYRYSGVSPILLNEKVNPSIIKLTQTHHSKGMAEEGPFSSPEHD